MLKKISCSIIALWVVAMVSAQTGKPKFGHLSTQQGLSQSVVTTILQDRSGFMWIGTQDGLNKYDGAGFTVYQNTDTTNSTAISGNFIKCLFQDSKGLLWIGTDKNGLNLFDPATVTFQRFYHDPEQPNSLPSDQINAVTENNDGSLWIGTSTGLCRYYAESKHFLPIRLMANRTNYSVNVLEKDSLGNLWVGTDNGLFCYNISTGNTQAYLSSEQTNTDRTIITSLAFRNNKSLYVGSSNGLSIINLDDGSIASYYAENLGAEFSAFRNEISSLAFDKRNNLWIGSFGGGLLRWNLATEQPTLFMANVNEAGSISNDYIMSAMVDSSGLLWVGTYGGGISTLDQLQVKFNRIAYNGTALGLPGSDVYSIAESRKYIWIGTDFGLVRKSKQTGKMTTLKSIAQQANTLSDNTIYSLLLDNQKRLWVGTSDGGLDRISKPDADQIVIERFSAELSTPLPSNTVLSIRQHSSGSLWVGTNKGLCRINKQGQLDLLLTNQPGDSTSLSNNEVQYILEDKNHDLWVGTYSGLNRLIAGEQHFVRYMASTQNPNALPNNTVYCLAEDDRGQLWMGTDGGLSCLSPNRQSFTNYTQTNGLPDNVVYGILLDNDNTLWASTNNGLCNLKPQTDVEEYSFVNYNKGNWLDCEEFNIGAFFKDSQGQLYFGGMEGLVYFHPADIKGNQYVPPVAFTDFLLSFQEVPITPDGSGVLSKHISQTNTLHLNHTQTTINIEFAALNYIEPHKNEYAYMLEGFDRNWINLGNRRHDATYTMLSPGKYVFRVKASNNNGVWNNEGRSLQIIITPPFYQRWWFYTLVVITLVLSAFGYVRSRMKRMKNIQKILEQKVKERTAEVEQQKEELQTALERLRTTQTQLVNSEKMASLGQLTAGVAHEINNPINFISGNIMPLKRDLDDILEILVQYEEEIEKQGLSPRFERIRELKEQLDYDLVVDEISDLIRGIEEGAHRTTQIVKGLRNFSRLDEEDMKPANINEGLESTLLILRNKIKNRIEVERNFEELPDVMCYPGKLNQVFMNILNNASDAIEGNGRITISTSVSSCSLQQNGRCIKVRIADTGKGMPETVLNRIFDPFFTTKAVGRGTGLGLSISFGIIEDHGGKIEVNSQPEKGTEFIITLPFKTNGMGMA